MPHWNWRLPVIALCLVGFSVPGMAAPVAIVEDSSLADPGVMDYLDQGRVLTLKRGERLVLGYLNSCIREEIEGGTVTIGASESVAQGGNVKRTVIPCGGTAALSQAQAGKSGALVLRQAPGKSKQPGETPSLTVSSLTPVLRPHIASGALKLQRIDQPAEAMTLPAAERLADLQQLGIQLAPGGVYRASSGQRTIVFRVDPTAREAGGPLLSRLVHF